MFVEVRNNLKDSTAVVAYAHIPPGETRQVRARDYEKWKANGGQRLLDANQVEEVTTTASVPDALPPDSESVDEGGLSDSPPPAPPADDVGEDETYTADGGEASADDAEDEGTSDEAETADDAEEEAEEEATTEEDQATEETTPAPAAEPKKRAGRGR